MDEETQRNKAHKAKLVGNKAAKRDEQRKKRAGIDLEPNRGKNVKAFQSVSAGSHKAQKLFRSVEKRESTLHVPTMDKTFRHIVAEPPLLVAVVGPPGVGKTTLIRSMVKFYSNRNLQSVRGPITVIAGRSRRVTFLECPNTLAAMCDVAKVADLILLMVDGSFGFEMETFEFLNIAQVHGFPKMFGVVSHLDQLKTGKALKKRKKFLRHRFWHEVAAGAKLLCLAPMIRGMYRPSDVLNLHRLLICVEPKVQSWRNTHSCVLIDRQEDITDPAAVAQDERCNRTIAFYGYARGKPMRAGQLVHVPGLGDYAVQHISHHDDPCAFEQQGKGSSQGHRMRHLSTKHKKLYAPYCDVGGISYDDDAIYVQEDAEKAAIERTGEGVELLRALQRATPMDAAKTALSVVRRPVVFRDEDAMELDMDEVRMPDDDDSASSASSDDDDENEATVGGTGQQAPTLGQFGLPSTASEAVAEDDAEADGLAPRARNAADSVRITSTQHDWHDPDLLRALKDLCVTGRWTEEEGADDDNAGEAGVTPEDKGYESEDEEFDAVVRGEKGMPRSASPPVAAADEGAATVSEEDATNTSSPRRARVNALAGVAWQQQGNGTGQAVMRGRRARQGDDADDTSDYDILAEEEQEGAEDTTTRGAGGVEDEELDGLVSSFLVSGKSRGAGAAAVRTARQIVAPAQADGATGDEDGIAFYDPKAHLNEIDARRTAGREAEEEAAMASAAVVGGDALTADQERLMQKKMEKKAAFDEAYDAGAAGARNMTYSYYHQLQRNVEAKKERLDSALREVGEDLEKKIQLLGYFSGLYVRFVLSDIPVEFVRLFDPAVPLIAGGVNAGEDEFRVVQARLKRHRWYPKILKAQDPVLLSMGWRRFQTQPIFATEDPNGRVRYLKYTPLHMHCVAAFYAPVAPPNTGFIAIPVREQRAPSFRISCTGYTVGNDATASVVKKLKLTGTPAKIDKTTVFIKGMFSSDVEAARFVGAKVKSVSGVRGIIKAALKGKHGLVRATFEDKLFMSDIVFIRAWTPVEPPRYCAMQRNLVDKEWAGMRSMRELRWAHQVPLKLNADSAYVDIKRRNRGDEEDATDEMTAGGGPGGAARVLLSRSTKLQLPYDMKEEFIPLETSNALRTRLQAATTVAPEVREQRRQALLDAFQDRAETMTKKKNEVKKRARERAAREAAKENEQYLRGLKRAKKETARRSEFRSQHKTRK